MKKINLVVTGCLGRMGQQIIKSTKNEKNFRLVAVTENKIINKKVSGLKAQLNSVYAFKNANMIIDFTIQQTCGDCSGAGEVISSPCKKCRGLGKRQARKKILANIPRGVDDGTRIRLSGKGEAGIKGGGNGDLYIFVSINPHNIFKRSEENLFFEFPISLTDAALGTTVEVPTIDGKKAKVKIPAGTQSGKQFRLKEKGMPMIRNKSYGDLYIQVITEVPVSLTKEQKNLLEQFKKLEDTKTNPSMKDFFEKAKKFWRN